MPRNRARCEQAEDLLPELLEQSEEGAVVFDGAGTITLVTAGFERMLGSAPGALAGRNALDLVHPDDRALAASVLRRMVEGGNTTPRTMHFRLRHCDGSWVRTEVLAAPGRLDDGRMIATVRDVSRRDQMVVALADAHELQALVGRIAARLARVPVEDVDHAVRAALGELGPFAGADRASVFRFSAGLERMEVTHAWSARGVPRARAARRVVHRDELPQWFATSAAGEDLRIADVDALPTSWAAERRLLRSWGVRAALGVPMSSPEGPMGLVVFERTRPKPAAKSIADTLRLLHIAADVIGSALARQQALASSRRQEARYRALVEHSNDLIVVIDETGRLLMPAMGEPTFGFSTHGRRDLNVLDFVHPQDVERARCELDAAQHQPGYRVTMELRVRSATDEWVPVELVAVNRLDDALVGGIVLNVRDLRDRKRVERELRESEHRYRALVQNIPGAVFRCQAFPPYHDEFVSDAIIELTGYPAADFIDQRVVFDELILPGHRERTDRELQHAIERRAPVDIEYPILHRDGAVRWISERGQITYDGDRPLWLEGALFDITARKQLEQRLAFEASHDPLTGLPNRTQLLTSLGRALKRAARTPLTVAALFIDLDRFKLVNDALGHAAGDDLLVAFARRLSGVLRASDLASRTGGDEFVVMCTDIGSPVEAEHVAHRIARTLSAPFSIQGREVFVTASIGIAVADPTSDAAGLVRDADAAAYRAKERGRNRYEVFDEALRAETAAALEIESALHRAIEENQLALHYQPVVDLDTRALTGYEVLLRWHHPDHGILGPDRFLAAAEASGLIVAIGSRVVELACSTLGRLPADPPLTIAVNLSPRELAQPDLITRLDSAIARHGIDPSRLCLEITESALLDDGDAAMETLLALERAGVRLAIDDFGTGYSSLSYLRRLPVDIVKIDRSFVAEIGAAAANDTVIRTIISLARELELDVIAEGIEHEEQVDVLRRLGCRLGQGHLFGRAAPLPEVRAAGVRH